MINCPCCSNQMLHHIRGGNMYWFCRSCWQEMPVLEMKNSRVRQQLTRADTIFSSTIVSIPTLPKSGSVPSGISTR